VGSITLRYPGALQELLLAPGMAQLLGGFLNGTSWTLPALAEFLAGPAAGPGLTWHRVYADADAVLGTLSQVMEVRVAPAAHAGWPPSPAEPCLRCPQCICLDKIEAVATEEQLVARALELLEKQQFWAAVVFEPPTNATAPTLPPHVRYKIRMDIDDVTRTNKIKDRSGDARPKTPDHPVPAAVGVPSPSAVLCPQVLGPGPRSRPLQRPALRVGGVRLRAGPGGAGSGAGADRGCPADRGLRPANALPLLRGRRVSGWWGTAPAPRDPRVTPCCGGRGRSVVVSGCRAAGGRATATSPRFLRVLNRSLPLFMTLAWIYSVAMIIKGVVHEKETRLKETMKTMGLSNGILWLSWFLSSFIPFLLSSALLVLILKAGCRGWRTAWGTWGASGLGTNMGGSAGSNLP